jgi:hypothetical protein
MVTTVARVMQFLLDVKEFESLPETADVRRDCLRLFKLYIEHRSPRDLRLDDATRKATEKRIRDWLRAKEDLSGTDRYLELRCDDVVIIIISSISIIITTISIIIINIIIIIIITLPPPRPPPKQELQEQHLRGG